MARFARVVVPGAPYHITHRGNLRAAIFFSDEGRQVYLQLLQQCCERFALEVWSFCLIGASWLAQGLDEQVEHRLRDNTYSGRPTGSEAFIDRLESDTGRLLRPQKPGRKAKASDDGAVVIDDLFA